MGIQELVGSRRPSGIDARYISAQIDALVADPTSGRQSLPAGFFALVALLPIGGLGVTWSLAVGPL